jgi:hypothetical protein
MDTMDFRLMDEWTGSKKHYLLYASILHSVHKKCVHFCP